MTQDPARRGDNQARREDKEEDKMFGKRKSSRAASPNAGPASEEAVKPGAPSTPRARASTEPLSGRSKTMSPQPYEAPARRVSDYVLPSARGDIRTGRGGEGRKLVVGRDISLAGEIKSCELLIVEGLVEADLKGCQLLQISDSGVYRGSAEVAQAEINGRFEGDLVVTERLVLRSTGSVQGNLRYNELEIERGGRISGSVDDLDRASPQASEPTRADTGESEVLPRRKAAE